MTSRLPIIATAVALALLAVLPASASAGTNIGATCDPVQFGNTTLMQFSVDANAPSYTVPTGGGVLTRWALTREAGATPNPTKLKLFKPSATPNQFTTVAEAQQTVVAGENQFVAHIPVSGGEVLGLYGGTKTPTCGFGTPLNVLVGFNPNGDTPLNSTLPVLGNAPSRVLDLAAYIEPDNDHDGFGDETEDACPILATTQGACPPVDAAGPAIDTKAFKLSKLIKGKRPKSKIEMTIGSNEAATVTLDGTLSVPGGASKTFTLKPVSKPVAANGKVKIALKVPKKGLKALRKRKKATAVVNVAAKDAAGNTSTGKFTSKVKIVKTKRIIRR